MDGDDGQGSSQLSWERGLSRRSLLKAGVGGTIGLALGGVAGPLSSVAQSAGQRKVPTTPQGTLRVALADLRNQNWLPETGSGTRQLYSASVFEYPFMARLDKVGLAPGLCTAYRLAPDARSLTAKIRKGVKFHDGTEMTSQDIAFTFDLQRMTTSSDTDAARWRANVVSIDTSDPYEIRFNFNTPIADFPASALSLYSFYMMVNSKAYCNRVGLTVADQKPIGTGPYRWVSQKPDYIELAAVKNHWRVTPQFERLVFTQVPDQATQIAQLKDGQVDLINVDVDGASQLRGDKSLHEFVVPAAYNAMLLFGNNFTKADKRYTGPQPWSDIRVRKALNLAINRDEIVKSLYKGNAKVARIGLLDSQLPAKYKPYPYDPSQAVSLLAAAGYSSGELTIQMASWSRNPGEELPTLVQIVAAYWAQIGVKTQIIPQDYASFIPKWFAGKIPNTVFPLTLNTFYPSWQEEINSWYMPNAALATYQDAAISKISNGLASTRIPAKRSALFENAAIDLYNNYAEIPIAIPEALYFASKRLATWTPPTGWYQMYYEYATENPPVDTPRTYVPNVPVPTF